MKRIFIILIALLVVVSLSACTTASESKVDKYDDVKIIKITPVVYATSSVHRNNLLISYIQENEYKQMTWPANRIRLTDSQNIEFVEDNGMTYLCISEDKLIQLMD